MNFHELIKVEISSVKFESKDGEFPKLHVIVISKQRRFEILFQRQTNSQIWMWSHSGFTGDGKLLLTSKSRLYYETIHRWFYMKIIFLKI